MERKVSFDLRKYEEWCVKENKDPLNKDTLELYQKTLEKAKLDALNKAKAADEEAKRKEYEQKAKELFDQMCAYVGVKVKFVPEVFPTFHAYILSIVGAMAATRAEKDVNELIEKVLGKGE